MEPWTTIDKHVTYLLFFVITDSLWRGEVFFDLLERAPACLGKEGGGDSGRQKGERGVDEVGAVGADRRVQNPGGVKSIQILQIVQ